MIYDTTIFGEIYFIFPYGIIMTSSWALMTSYRGMLWSEKFAPPIFVILITQKYHFNHKINLDTKIARNYKSSCTITLVCVSCIFLLSFRSPAITFGPHFTFNDSKMTFFHVIRHFISFANRNNKSNFAS